jgi:hypothetical protein
MYIQLQLLGDQLHQHSLSGGVSPVSFLLAHMLTLLYQFPRADPKGHASTQVGLPRLIRGLTCTCLPFL